MFALAPIPVRIGYYGTWQCSSLFVAFVLFPRRAVDAGRYEPYALSESIEEEDGEFDGKLYAECIAGSGGGQVFVQGVSYAT